MPDRRGPGITASARRGRRAVGPRAHQPRGLVAGLLAGALTGLVVAPVAAAGAPGSWSSAAWAAEGGSPPVVEVGEPVDDAPAVDDLSVPRDGVDLGTVGSPLRFVAGPGAALELADGRRLLDTVELRLVGDGQRLINDLGIDDYVAGVAEMPSRWHEEALKAQAVAARTYAWHLIELGTFSARGYDICDTVDCQVFRGAAQEEAEFGDRWRAAVDATAGEVLLDDQGGPILARYFSTSGGRTLPNEVVFPSSGSRPYLVGTEDPADAVSPFHRWEVTFTRDEFDAITAAGSTLGSVTPVQDVERLGPTHIPNAEVRFTGPDGRTVTLGSVEVRRFVSQVAPQRFPDRFPSLRADGQRPLPATLPSSRFQVDLSDDEVVVRGLGWGHAVGMGQYGALGRARDGATYDDILAAYYAGLTPQRTDALPDRVRVGLSQAAVGSVRGDAPFAIVADGEVLTEDATGTWRLSRDGTEVRVTAPPGWGEPAEVSRTQLATTLPSGAHAIALEATSATPGEARLVVRDGSGQAIVDHSIGAVDPGSVTSRWDLRDADGETVEEGVYEVALEVRAADGTRDGTALPLRIHRPEPDPVLPTLGGETPWVAVALAASLLAAAAVLIGVARRRAPAATGRSAPDARSERSGQEEP